MEMEALSKKYMLSASYVLVDVQDTGARAVDYIVS